MNKQIVKSAFESINIELSDIQVQQFVSYYELLIEWNNFMNLTAITEENEVLTKHFLDSVSLVLYDDVKLIKKIQDGDITSVIDIGTGAGFPGIPLKIVFSNIKVTLLDSLNKRVKFLNKVIDDLKLEGIIALHGRAEEFAKKEDFREKYDLCVSRAVANLSTLSEYCLPFVRVNKYFIPFKSQKLDEEITNAKKCINVMGGKFLGKYKFFLPGTEDERTFAYIKKVKNTPKKFPRGGNKPVKEPIC